MGVASDAERLASAVRNPARLVLGPTTTTGAYPYGGTGLGFAVDVELEWTLTRYYLNRDPAGGAVSEIGRKSVEVPVIFALLDGNNWDEDVLNRTFSQTTTGTYTPTESRIEGTVHTRVVSAWPPLLVAAVDPQHKSIYFRRPLSLLSFRQAVQFANTRRAGLPLSWLASPDENYATTPYWQIARLENLTL